MWFKNRVAKIQAKEVQQFLAEIALRDEAYCDTVKNAGFDDSHYYEDYISFGCFKMFIVIIVVIAIVVTGLIYLMK